MTIITIIIVQNYINGKINYLIKNMTLSMDNNY